MSTTDNVDFVMEVVEVSIVFLTVLVSQYLNVFSVLCHKQKLNDFHLVKHMRFQVLVSTFRKKCPSGDLVFYTGNNGIL